jgi:hypothetical protein
MDEVAQEGGLAMLVDAVADELEDPAGHEEHEMNGQRDGGAGEVEGDRHGQHHQREAPLDDEVVRGGGGDEEHGRVEAHRAGVEELQVREHADEREHDHRDAEAVKGFVAFGLVVRGVVGEECFDVLHGASVWWEFTGPPRACSSSASDGA